MRVVLFALSMTLGAWWLQQQGELPPLIHAFILLPLAVIAWWCTNTGEFARRLALLIVCIPVAALTGYYWAAGSAQSRLSSTLGESWHGRDVRIEGVIAEMTRTGEQGTRFVMDVERIYTVGAKVPDRIRLTWYKAWSGNRTQAPRLLAGQRWQLTARLRPPHANFNPHGFNAEAAMLERRIRAIGYVRDGGSAKLVSDMVRKPTYLIERTREHIRSSLRRVTDGQPMAGVLVALAIGDQAAIPPDQWTVFTNTGVNHLMSISGLHITMVSGLAFLAAFWLWRRSARLALRVPPVRAATLIGLMVAVVYAALSGFAIPAQRTIYMLSVVALALWSGWRWPAPSILGAALIIVIAVDPFAVVSAGFWLSFGAVATIMIVSAADSRRVGWLRTWIRMQLAITVALTPLLLILFQKVSLVSPIANAVAIPIISLCVAPLAILLIALPVEFIATFAQEVMRFCFLLLEYLSSLPGAIWQQHAPAAWTVALAIGGIIVLLLPRGFPGRWIGAILVVPMFVVVPAGPKDNELWLTVLDVGQGLSVVARTRNHALLFDTGPDYRGWGDAGKYIVSPFLRGEGIAMLDYLLVSHDDLDHAGGAASVLDSVPADIVMSSAEIVDSRTDDIQIKRCEAGQVWTLDNVQFEILHPDSDSYQTAELKDNDRSCVLRIDSPFGSVLLPADIERRSERQLIKDNRKRLKADVLVAPHHGSSTSSGKRFIEAVNPRIVVFPVGFENPYGHPHPRIVARYKATGARMMRTDHDGAITLKFTASGMDISTWRKTKQRFWH